MVRPAIPRAARERNSLRSRAIFLLLSRIVNFHVGGVTYQDPLVRPTLPYTLKPESSNRSGVRSYARG